MLSPWLHCTFSFLLPCGSVPMETPIRGTSDVRQRTQELEAAPGSRFPIPHHLHQDYGGSPLQSHCCIEDRIYPCTSPAAKVIVCTAHRPTHPTEAFSVVWVSLPALPSASRQPRFSCDLRGTRQPSLQQEHEELPNLNKPKPLLGKAHS